MGAITYLAGPYTKGGPEVRQARFRVLTAVAAKLIEQERIIYSPITMTHPIDLILSEDGETLGSRFWIAFDDAFMQCCSSLIVVTLPGWEISSGVAHEIEFFAQRDIAPEYLSPESLGISKDDRRYFDAFTEGSDKEREG